MVTNRKQPVRRTASSSRASSRVTSTRVGDIGKRAASAQAQVRTTSKLKSASSKKSIASKASKKSVAGSKSASGKSASAAANAAVSSVNESMSRKTTKRRVSGEAVARVYGKPSGKTGTARAAGNYRKLVLAVVAVVALIAACIGGYIALYNSNVFEIEEVSVKGVDHLTASDIQNLAGVDQGTTLLNVDADRIREALLVDAWVQDVKVNRLFPHTLELDVTERTITAVVKVPSSDGTSTVDWAISSDGMWLMPIPAQDSEDGKLVNPQVYEDAANVLVISEVPYTTKPEIGTYCTDENVNNALSIVASLTTDLSSRVTAVKATETQSTTLTIKDGPDIVFGTSENIREKERVCLEIMEAHPDGVSYINVRNVSRPTYRAL